MWSTSVRQICVRKTYIQRRFVKHLTLGKYAVDDIRNQQEIIADVYSKWQTNWEMWKMVAEIPSRRRTVTARGSLVLDDNGVCIDRTIQKRATWAYYQKPRLTVVKLIRSKRLDKSHEKGFESSYGRPVSFLGGLLLASAQFRKVFHSIVS